MRWQRRARLAIGVFGLAFLVIVALSFKQRTPRASTSPATTSDPKAVFETTQGETKQFKSSREEVQVKYERLRAYEDGTTRLSGVTVTTTDREIKDRVFTITSREGTRAANGSSTALDGAVRLAASDGLVIETEHATYTESDSMVRGPGPVEFSKGRMTGRGTGLTFDNARDVLTILDQAEVNVAADDKGAGATAIASGTAIFARREHYVQFDRGVRIQRGGQTIEADAALARLSADEKRIESLELHKRAHVAESRPVAGGLQDLGGSDMTLSYAADGQTLQHALIVGDAVIQLAAEGGKAGRQIRAKSIDLTMGPDGASPTALSGRDDVELKFPAEGTTPGRTIQAATLDAKGEPGRGLTRALFAGGVRFREQGGQVDRAATSTTLEAVMKPGMGSIDEARFVHAVRFEEGKLLAQAAAARYDLAKGTLELSGSEAGSVTPHVVNEQIAVDAAKIDVTLEGPLVKAAGSVKSTLKPAKQAERGGSDGTTRMPAMLKQDQPVSIVADNLDYDGGKTSGTYSGNARLFQGADTTIKAETIALDQKRGDLTAHGKVMTTTTREQTNKNTQKKERVQSTATATDFKYEDEPHKLTYTGGAHMVGPEGDMTASRIDLYLKEAGDELDHAEAFTEGSEKLTLREQNRTTTGQHMTYTADRETYVVNGRPATVVDECTRETIGTTLTFVKATDTILVDGNQQIRTQTRGGSSKCQ